MYQQVVRTGITISLAICLLAIPDIVSAKEPCYNDLISTEQVFSKVQLSPQIPHQNSSEANQIIYESRVLVPFREGMHVLLTASADGRDNGELVTDDAVKIHVKDTNQVWDHDFRTGPNGAIQAIPPVDLTYLFKDEPGVSLVSFHVMYQATNVLAPESRSSEYWLIVWKDCIDDEPLDTVTATPVVSAPTPAQFARLETPSTPSATATATQIVAATSTVETTFVESSSLNVNRATLAQALSNWLTSLPRWAIGMVIGFLLAIVGVALWAPFASNYRAEECIEVRDAISGKLLDTCWLAQMRHKVVTIGANDDIWLPDLQSPHPVAKIYSRGRGADRTLMMDIFSEVDPMQVQHTVELYDGFQVRFGSAYLLTYVNQQAESNEQEHAKEQNYAYEI